MPDICQHVLSAGLAVPQKQLLFAVHNFIAYRSLCSSCGTSVYLPWTKGRSVIRLLLEHGCLTPRPLNDVVVTHFTSLNTQHYFGMMEGHSRLTLLNPHNLQLPPQNPLSTPLYGTCRKYDLNVASDLELPQLHFHATLNLHPQTHPSPTPAPLYPPPHPSKPSPLPPSHI